MMIDHHKAKRKNIASRYVLGELTAREREEFETHYFDCRECGEDVNALLAISGSRSVLAEVPDESPEAFRSGRRVGWLESFRGWTLRPAFAIAPLFALVVLTGLTTYQVSASRRQPAAQAILAFTLHPEARGEDTAVPAAAGPFFVLNVDVPGVAERWLWQIRRADSTSGFLDGAAPSPPPGAALTLLIPASQLPPGAYILSVRHATAQRKDSPEATYRFRMQ